MITVLQETTDWKGASVGNGEYHVNDRGHLVGYQGPTTEFKKFEKPLLHFNRGGRTFNEVGTYDDEGRDSILRIPFDGSKGNTYFVTLGDDDLLQCTCPGYMYRGACKHVTSVIEDGP
jgi:hypothetical protein